MLAVLLRVLEYHQGVLFLTTNRVEDIDEAFLSRIHFALAYPALSVSARSGLWRTFISRAHPEGLCPTWLEGQDLRMLAESGLNARQIRNVVRVAHAVATDSKRSMCLADISAIIQASKEFNAVFDKSPWHGIVSFLSKAVTHLLHWMSY